MSDGFDISFVNLHRIHEKCTPEQITLYQMSLKLHKLLNEHENQLSFELITIMDQIVCTGRQLNFQIMRNFRTKIGLNTTANKLYPLNNQISWDRLNMNFVHYKKLAKIQFLKNGKTWIICNLNTMWRIICTLKGHEPKLYVAVCIWSTIWSKLIFYRDFKYVLQS